MSIWTELERTVAAEREQAQTLEEVAWIMVFVRVVLDADYRSDGFWCHSRRRRASKRCLTSPAKDSLVFREDRRQGHGVFGPVGAVHEWDRVHIAPSTTFVEHEKIPQQVGFEDEPWHRVPHLLDGRVAIVGRDPVFGALVVEELGLEAHLCPFCEPGAGCGLAV